jgi:hypothetical protein
MSVVKPYWEEKFTHFEIDFSKPGEFDWVLYATVKDATLEEAEGTLAEIRGANKGIRFRLAKMTRSVLHEAPSHPGFF